MRRLAGPIAMGTALVVVVAGLTTPAAAHVKWFSDFDFRDPPRPFGEVVDGRFLVLLALTAVAMGVLPLVDDRLDGSSLYRTINTWLAARRHHSVDVVRFSMAGVLLITWASRALLTPELAEPADWVGWVEFALVLLLLWGRVNEIAGAGLVGLWLIGVVEYGAFHMLDYLHIIGLGVFLIVRAVPSLEVRGLGVPVLSLTVGFSLMWLGFEKLVYPEWGLAVLGTEPILRLGLPADFFLDGAAFVEIALGFLLVIGLLGRPLAVVVTGVFVLSTLVFGRVEIIGHTPVHAALVVFLLHGPGSTYPAPIAIHRSLRLRSAFAAVNFVVLALVVGVAYTAAARVQFDNAVAELGPLPPPVEATSPTPSLTSVRVIDGPTGPDVHLVIDGWTFAPPLDPANDSATGPIDTGYGVLTVDGAVIARFDDAQAPLWTDVDGVTALLDLFTVDGRRIELDGEPLRIEVQLPS